MPTVKQMEGVLKGWVRAAPSTINYPIVIGETAVSASLRKTPSKDMQQIMKEGAEILGAEIEITNSFVALKIPTPKERKKERPEIPADTQEKL